MSGIPLLRALALAGAAASLGCADATTAPPAPTRILRDGARSAAIYETPGGPTRIVYSEGGAVVATVVLSVPVAQLAGGATLTVIPARGARRTVTVTAADLQAARQRPAPTAAVAPGVAADDMGPGCGGYVRATLLSLGSMVVMAVVENPLGFFLSAMAVANGVYDYAQCQEAAT